MEKAKLPTSKKITSVDYPVRYSICTLVTDAAEYQQMLLSFVAAGFVADFCEFLYIDNIASNQFDAYKGINRFLQEAKGERIIICHQDVLINNDRLTDLENRISEIDKLDKSWAILSNAGGLEDNLYQRMVAHVYYPDGFEQIMGVLPQKVCSVDEHFILIKNAANLVLSRDLSGFHLYGLDLCLIAELLGFNAYAIDFLITHKSYGNPNESYDKILRQLQSKYFSFLRNRQILTTFKDFQFSASPFKRWLFSLKWTKKIARKSHKIKQLNASTLNSTENV